MKNIYFKVAAIAALCIFSMHSMSYAQEKSNTYKIELKMLRPKISLASEASNLIFNVTVTKLAGKPEDLGTTFHYCYKKFHGQDYYLEAFTMDGKEVDIDGEDDADMFFDDPDDTTRNINKLTQKINTSAYNFSPGKYKLRWVYDPSGNVKSNSKMKVAPTYSNWEELEVTE